jgi:lipopolysaccharide cholinephosphotransferase
MNLAPEERNGFLISAEMKKVWHVEMQLLNKLLEVCNKHHLKVWAEGGSLLGTVRERGFIPWDDDIDMAMMRDDYDKLQSVAKDEFKAPYFFQSGYTDRFANGLTRLRMDGTTAITDLSINDDYHQGIFIDLFPLDIVPDDDDLRDQFIRQKVRKKEALKYAIHYQYCFSNWKYNWNIFKNRMKIRINGFHSCFQEYDRFIKQYWGTDNHKVSLISWVYDKRYLREKEWYNDTIYLPFENIMMPVPGNYDAILRTQYGDYMKPVKAPTMHGGLVVLDPDHSYKDYITKVRKERRKEASIKKIQKKLNLKK